MIKLLALAAVLGASCCTVPKIETSEKSTYTLEFADGHCSGTSITENVILSAAHCFTTDEAITFKIDGRTAKVKKIARDGNDHVLVMVDIAFENQARLTNKKLIKGDKIYFYGNPGLRHLYRTGYMAGYRDTALVLDINGWHGDSGAAIFNDEGNIVTVVSAGYTHAQFKMTIAYPLAFTRAQYERFGL